MLEVINSGITKAYVHASMKIENFKVSEKGVTAVEYAIVVAGVAAVAAVIFGKDGTVNTMLTGIFAKITTSVAAFDTK
ncbi:Flp/Fap pilin component [compost metagenome]